MCGKKTRETRKRNVNGIYREEPKIQDNRKALLTDDSGGNLAHHTLKDVGF